jgi:hypothetical protein
MEPRKPGILETLLALASTAAMAWVVMPPQERFWVKLTVLQKAHQLAGRLAYQVGHRGMGDELSDRDFQRYEIAFWLSSARDELAKALDGMKP